MATNVRASKTSGDLSWRACVGLASLLAFGTIAWQHLVHAWIAGPAAPLRSHLSHALRDGTLAWPLAVLAVLGGLGLFRWMQLAERGPLALVARTGLIAVAFAAMLVPAVVGHALIDAGLRGGSAAALAMAASINANLSRFLDYSVREALISLVAAVPLTLLGLVSLNAPASSPRHRRWSRRLAPATAVVALLVGGSIGGASPDVAEFEATDDPGSWFKCVGGTGCVPAGTQSLAVIKPGDAVRITIGAETDTVHTFTSLVYPTGAPNMPFDQPAALKKGQSDQVTLSQPGLYVFVCKLHPFMLAAAVVDDPATPGLDVGENISLLSGLSVPSASDLGVRLLRAFFLITNPAHYQDRNPETNPTLAWKVDLPAVDVRLTGGAVVNLSELSINTKIGGPVKPAEPGVGEIWVDAQYEMTASKTKPGTVTAVDAKTWEVTKKFGLPEVNLNNPHNMWTDRDQRLIYQTQWFSDKLTVFDRLTGHVVQNIAIGESPAHVMTRVDTDQVHVTLNGEDAVIELAPGATHVQRRIPTQFDFERPAQPHAHWMSFDGKKMVTPNSNTDDSTQLNLVNGSIVAKVPTGRLPIASGMMPDASKYYVSNYADSTITCVSIGAPACHDGQNKVATKTIHLLAGYDPVTGSAPADPGGSGAPLIGGLPIQTPVAPHGKYMITANTLTATILIIDTATDTVVRSLPCSAGCHGVNFGAKQGGGYYAYVSSKFSNDLIVVDPDPNNDGNPIDAKIVGRVLLTAGRTTRTDDNPTLYAGLGGQGVLPIPLVYHGWVQNLPPNWKNKLTSDQRNPVQ
jgi:DNA-binding beta-propeller fold protein YncE